MSKSSLALVVLFALTSGAFAQGMHSPCNFDGLVGGKRTDDLAVFHPTTGNWHIKTLAGTIIASPYNWGWNETTAAPGDYNGDGISDLGVFHRATGNWYIRTLAGANLAVGYNWGWNETVPVPADYDGDGRTDLAVYQRSTGNWYIHNLFTGQAIASVNWGWSECSPVPGDYNGDGKADLAVFHRATGNWYIRTVSGTTLAMATNWGWSATRAMAADFDGDGKADLAVFHRATGNWYIRTLSGTVLASMNWGWNLVNPAPGDYDGDGKADLGVYHRATGNWYIWSLTAGQLASPINWGWSETAAAQSYAHRSSDGLTMLAFGDSVTRGEASSSDGPLTGYPMLLEQKMDTFYGGHFFTINAGQGGEKTSAGKLRLPGLLDTYHPDVVLLMEGVNDALTDAIFEKTKNNLRTMIQSCKSRGIDVIIGTITPVKSDADKDRFEQQQRIQSFIPAIQDLARTEKVPQARVYENFTATPNWSTLLNDYSGNHPNDRGYAVVRDAFYSSVSGIISSGAAY